MENHIYAQTDHHGGLSRKNKSKLRLNKISDYVGKEGERTQPLKAPNSEAGGDDVDFI